MCNDTIIGCTILVECTMIGTGTLMTFLKIINSVEKNYSMHYDAPIFISSVNGPQVFKNNILG